MLLYSGQHGLRHTDLDTRTANLTLSWKLKPQRPEEAPDITLPATVWLHWVETGPKELASWVKNMV